jgi:hypothetical protein
LDVALLTYGVTVTDAVLITVLDASKSCAVNVPAELYVYVAARLESVSVEPPSPGFTYTPPVAEKPTVSGAVPEEGDIDNVPEVPFVQVPRSWLIASQPAEPVGMTTAEQVLEPAEFVTVMVYVCVELTVTF